MTETSLGDSIRAMANPSKEDDEDGEDTRRLIWPVKIFGWKEKIDEQLPGDVPLGEALLSIDTQEVDWDLMVWWNEEVARAATHLYEDPTLLPTSLWKGAASRKYVSLMIGRIPRSERRAVLHLEYAIGHLLRSVEDQTGRPFRVYDPETGVWRQEGEWINQRLAGLTVMSMVDEMIGSFEGALHRAVDFMRACVDVCAPWYPEPEGEDKVKWEADMAERARMLEPIKQAHTFARGISQGTYKAIRSELRNRLAIKQTKWDAETKWVVLGDGMINVDDVYRTGHIELFSFSPLVYSTMALEVSLHDMTRNAGLSEWERGVVKVLPDPEVRKYLQKRFGGALLGRPEMVDKSMVWQYGPGDTAKSTLQECIAGARGVFAPYALQSDSSILTVSGKEKGETERFKAYARGKRFAIMSEIDDGAKLDQSALKSLIGGDTVTGTAKYANSVSYFFTCTLFMASNHPPRMPSGDPAAATRIHVVPFEHRLWSETKNPKEWEDAEPEHRADPSWKERVLESPQERAAILRWVLDGLIQLGREGRLGDLPQAMKDKREDFLSEADPASRIIRTLLGEEPGWEGRAWIRLYTDKEWKETGWMDCQGVSRDRIDQMIEARARELEVVDELGRVPRNLVLSARNSLSDQGGTLKRAAIPGTSNKTYVLTRVMELSSLA